MFTMVVAFKNQISEVRYFPKSNSTYDTVKLQGVRLCCCGIVETNFDRVFLLNCSGRGILGCLEQSRQHQSMAAQNASVPCELEPLSFAHVFARPLLPETFSALMQSGT